MDINLSSLELAGLRHFFLIAYHRGFSRAARASGVSQPALSTGLKRLEKELGVLLVIRNPGEFRLTPAGSVLFDFCRRLEGSLLAVMKQITGSLPAPIERIRVGTSFAIGLSPLAEVFRGLTRAGPLEAEVVTADSYQLLQELQDGKIDAAFVPDEVQAADLRFLSLTKDQITLVGPAGLVARLKGGDWRTKLSLLPLVTYPRGSPMRIIVDRTLLREKLTFRASIAVSGVEALKTLCSRITSVGFVMRSLVEKEIGRGELHELHLPFSSPLPKRGIRIATRNADEALAHRLKDLFRG